jgi:hypothetical protein
MPTIDELDAAEAVSSNDAVLISQNGTVRRATQALVVAGLQTALAVPPGHLVGRKSAGIGAPEAIALGNGLSMTNGVLSVSPSDSSIAGLPTAGSPGGGDLVPLNQNGADMELPYAQFMAGISGLAGINGSELVVQPTGAGRARRLADLLSDSVAVESFGAQGDGTTDDTAAFIAAVASGQPVRLRSATYIVNGQWTINATGTTLIGTPGQSVLKRMSQAGGAWIAIQADRFHADGIVFDANRAAVSRESWGVQVGTQCSVSDFHRCSFLNASGPTLALQL